MSLRQSGFYCDVCDKAMVTEMLLNKPIPSFKVNGCPELLHCHKSCEELMLEAFNKEDETIMPNGPVRDLLRQIKEHNKKFEEKKEEKS